MSDRLLYEEWREVARAAGPGARDEVTEACAKMLESTAKYIISPELRALHDRMRLRFPGYAKSNNTDSAKPWRTCPVCGGEYRRSGRTCGPVCQNYLRRRGKA